MDIWRVRASRACFSSPFAFATSLPIDFCSALAARSAVSELRRRFLGGADGVDDALVLPLGTLAGTDEVGVLAEQLDVDHPRSVVP